ncbi:hypothetical protein GLV98_06145 [Halobacillus litoralis]|uniref:DUF4129 domain-containing protein n=1 Tax=Halobacillus litoralis TaxID=45668 RepID=A0A845E4D5_9BACI|nr:hypothetical protein [Halobacillus litoralis]MYL49056.1 hypothetical protein [Halobacillus litoralis]
MVEGKKNIIFVYQILGEAMLFFVLLFPLIQWTSMSLSYVLFSTYAIVSIVLFFLIRRWLPGLIPYLFNFAGIIAIAYFVGASLLLGLFVGSFLGWRYYRHERDPDLNHERSLILSTSILTFIMIFFFQSWDLVYALVSLYVVTWGGYAFSHYYNVDKRERKGGWKSLFVIFFSLITGTSIMLLLFPFLRSLMGKLWGGVSYAFLIGINGILTLLAKIGLDVSKIESMEEGSLPEMKFSSQERQEELQRMNDSNQETTRKVAEAIESGTVVLIVVALLLAMVTIFFLRKRATMDVETASDPLKYQYYAYSEEEKKRSSSSFSFHRSRTEGWVRKQFRAFEHFAARNGCGRYSNESLEDWFHRIGLDIDYTVFYQKVRYGSQTLTDEEKEQFALELKELKQKIVEKKQ